MYPPALLLRFNSKSHELIETTDVEYNRSWQFKRVGHNQWLMRYNDNTIAIININRLQSKIFWYEGCRWVVMPRKVSPSFEELSYKIDNRRRLRWTREGMFMSLIDGSLVHQSRAEIQYLTQQVRATHLDGYLKVFNTEFEQHVIASGFIAMILWSKPDMMAKLRDHLNFQSSKLNQGIWQSLIQCANAKH